MFEEEWVQLYYWHEANNFIMFFPGNIFEVKWMGTPWRRMVLLDPKSWKMHARFFKSEQGRPCHIRLIDKKFCKIEELKNEQRTTPPNPRRASQKPRHAAR